jgi:hypothetical protein
MEKRNAEANMKMIAGVCCFTLLLTMAARAEIEKIAAPCGDTGICFYWWPKLPQLKGWHQDKDQSYHYRINALAPNGSTFANAAAVIYAEAIYKPRVPETKSLEAFIGGDRKHFLSSDPHIAITEVSESMAGDGQKFRSFTFVPQSKGNWEEVSYGEEAEYYLTFVLSSRSKDGFDKNLDAYRQLVAHYEAKMQ